MIKFKKIGSLFFSIILMALFAQVTGCGQSSNATKVATPVEWWVPIEADLVIGTDEFYVRKCAITQVQKIDGKLKAAVVFKVSSGFLTSCRSGSEPLEYDGEYLILRVCKTDFGAGGCGYGRYRSSDFKYWEEYIGITWRNSEEYEAWRAVGSTSSKADSIKKVLN